MRQEIENKEKELRKLREQLQTAENRQRTELEKLKLA
jgi:hypothetical protein